jgi:hypothetical protein
MKKHQEIRVNGYDFIVEYNTPETPIEKINSTNCSQLIWVSFIPKARLTEYQCIDIFDSLEQDLLKEIKAIVVANKDFYNNFKVSYNFNTRTSNLYREVANIYVISMQVYLNIELK